MAGEEAIARVVWEAVKWTGEMLWRFIDGDDGPEPKRLVEALPPKFKSTLELARQRRLMRAELEKDVEPDSIESDDDD